MHWLLDIVRQVIERMRRQRGAVKDVIVDGFRCHAL